MTAAHGLAGRVTPPRPVEADQTTTRGRISVLRGVFPVLSTPFHADGGCDPAGLARLIHYARRAGAHGAVYPAIASEFATLDAAERHAMVDVALSACTKVGLPLVVGVSADGAARSRSLAEQAAAGGAAAVMLMVPRAASTSAGELANFVTEALAGLDIPVVLQNAPPPLGSALPVADVLAAVAALPSIRYVKEENVPCGQRITQLLEGAPAHLEGVMGGAGGRFVLDEYARGACGSMPSCELVEAHVAIWDAVQAGHTRLARDLFTRILPLLSVASVFRQAVVKEVLLRRGLIGAARFRDANPSLDRHDVTEIEALMEDLRDLMSVREA
jgi:4-hydroxy-tetrahydrodipicolinate synthase